MTCPNCACKVAPGELHSCGGPSLHAPWLQEAMDAQTAELKKIRELLTVVASGNRLRIENPEAKTRAVRRETR